ncbi:uncharacterized protein N7469_009383 [Penicillium citrinum]|uniref:non-reducing end alpha-L-arabinofuranosidase n=1 Tax=Penicillium citrinum TaxID=5077 RepID=A0A9W9THR5_PENCI|nr:uncharacterized protein N7469_009383 [Penicillium citrinum]KAJ5223143.1 hypothetical protein N7469_009383 [Penicillium citrinum]
MLQRYLLLPLLASCSAAVTISVAKSGGNATTNLQYGAMEEEINHCGEGGLYAELIRNRAFQGSEKFPSSLDAWTAVGESSLSLQNLSDPLSSALPTSVRVKGSGSAGLINAGFWGIDVRPQKYSGSFYVKGDYSGSFTASLSSVNGKTLASTKVKSKSVAGEWVQHEFTLAPKTKASSTNNTFSLSFDGSKAKDGYLDFNLISLFPPTWNDRPNGMRRDLMQALKDLDLKFLRFPGGNNLEGDNIEGRWKWNETIGPLKDRPGRATTWQYGETGGFGLIEYMEWCDDLNLEPILAVWGGLALNGDTIPESELYVYVQDALDELEFLTGSVDTKFGALRAKYGHPEPWKIKYVEVGNEDNLNNGLSSYKSYRFAAFYDAISEKYPDIQVLASTIDMTLEGKAGGDYHLYDTPDNFVKKFDFFDNHSPDHPILLGEIAATEFNNGGGGINWDDTNFSLYPWWIGSVSEAAPFLMNLDSYQWSPTIIAFDSNPDNTAKSTSWHVYDLFNKNHMTNTLPATSEDDFGPLYYATGVNSETKSHIFKAAVYNSTEDVPVSLTFSGVGRGTKADLTILTAPDAFSMNEVGGANLVKSKKTTIKAGKKGEFSFKLPNLSVAVLSTK